MLYVTALSRLLGALIIQVKPQSLPLVVHSDETVNVYFNMFLLGSRLNQVNILSYEMYVQHVSNSILHPWRFGNWRRASGLNNSLRYRNRRKGCGFVALCHLLDINY